LLGLNELIQADRRLFEEWKKETDKAIERSRDLAIDVAIDASVGYLVERYETIYGLAQQLPNKPEAVIEKYRHLAAMFKILQEAKETKDLDGLAMREHKTDAEIYEIMRDGIGQISGIIGLDKSLPGQIWKYGSLGFDMAYNITELSLVWKNMSALEANKDMYAQGVVSLYYRLGKLQERQAQLVRNIKAGEPRNEGARNE